MTTSTPHPAGNYAPVNGINLYYEIHGTGKPLILLHGGFGTFKMFSELVPTLAQSRQVIGVDLYGHGHTAMIHERPNLDLVQMSADIAGLIFHLGLDKVDLLGYSLGANTALQTAIRHPELLNKLVLLSIPFKRSDWYPDVLVGMASLAAEPLMKTPIYDGYVQVAPHPEDFPRLVAAMRNAMSQDYDWTEDVSALKVPTLLVAGDSDSLPPSHSAAFFSLLGGGLKDGGWNEANMLPSQLAILPGTTHYNILSRTDLLLAMLASFLDRA